MLNNARVDIDALLKDPAFDGLLEHQKERLRQMSGELEGKNITEALPTLMKYAKMADKSEKQFSKDEQKAMLSAFLNAIPESERSAIVKAAKLFGL